MAICITTIPNDHWSSLFLAKITFIVITILTRGCLDLSRLKINGSIEAHTNRGYLRIFKRGRIKVITIIVIQNQSYIL